MPIHISRHHKHNTPDSPTFRLHCSRVRATMSPHMTKHFTDADLVADLRGRLDGSSLRKTASEMGFSHSYLTMFWRMTQHPVRLGGALGYTKIPNKPVVQLWARKAK